MKRVPLILPFLLFGCAGAVVNYTPVRTTDGTKAYFINTVYGGLDGTKAQAEPFLQREATRLCPSGYSLRNTEEHKRVTAWGAENGQIDLVWEVDCKSA